MIFVWCNHSLSILCDTLYEEMFVCLEFLLQNIPLVVTVYDAKTFNCKRHYQLYPILYAKILNILKQFVVNTFTNDDHLVIL